MEAETLSSPPPQPPKKDPRTIARKYQLELCKKAVEQNIIVYLGTGCGKTHIAVLLMYELGHLIRKPSREVCVFLAPTIPLVRQQAMVIENSTDFKVRSYFGNRKCLKDHDEWVKEIEESEVLVMTPQILLQSLQHCFIKMELIALLIFDECHHAQRHTRHPYTQIMKDFYTTNTTKYPRIFGMTASPTVGKGGSYQLTYTKCINSLENLLDAKVCSVDDNLELESIVASPDRKIYFYDPVGQTTSSLNLTYVKALEKIKQQSISVLRERFVDSKVHQKKIKNLWKIHDNVVFCLENIGLWAAIQATQILLSSSHVDRSEMDIDENNNDSSFPDRYLNKAYSVLSCNFLDVADSGSKSFALETLEEPFFSNKLLVLIRILSTYRLKGNMKCIIFVKRIIVARSLAFILGNLKSLDFWKCEFLVGFHSGLRNMSRKKMDAIVEKFCSGQVNLLIATNVAEEGLDIQTCCLVVRFDLPETVASYIQSRGRARMLKSEYVFLVERGNERDRKLLDDFISGEDIMNKEITCRTSDETFDALEEKIYKVYTTGASISAGCSVSLLHRYCAKLPRDMYFMPTPKFFYMDESEGTICKIELPPNAPFRQVESLPCPSKDEAKRLACLDACINLHARGALTDYLLPSLTDAQKGSSGRLSECETREDDYFREELHEMLVPRALREYWVNTDSYISMHSYYIEFVPIPEDRLYRPFGLFVKAPLPKEAESMIVDLHLAHGRIVKTGLQPSGLLKFDSEEIKLAENFQEMCLKLILDRSEFFSDFVHLDKNDASQRSLSTFYLLLPVQRYEVGDNVTVDWTTVRRCLSSQVFGPQTNFSEKVILRNSETLELLNGPVNICDILGSLVFTPHNKLFFFIDGILEGINANSNKSSSLASYSEYYSQKFGIQLLYPEQPFLKAKQLFYLRNLLHNRLQETTEAREIVEHFVELPPELCLLKIGSFSKDVGSSLSLLPSLMHRLENLLVAIDLKDVLSASFPESSEIRASCILEALTTEKCMERLSLERFEVLGDAFLKYAVGRHSFLSYEGLDEGQLTRKRSSIVNNSHLYELAIKNNLQVYIRDELFEPSQFFALGRPCKIVCNVGTESSIHCKQGNKPNTDGTEAINVKCTKSHRWLHRKTIADVVEALVGAFLVESGFKAAIAFLQWIGIQVDFKVSDVDRACKESESNMSLNDLIDVASLEELIGHKFQHRGLLLQAFVHPSYNEHSGGCYQKLEFLGDAVLEYLITSYLYSVYPELKPGQITDLRSITVNNNSFAYIAVWRSFHVYLVKDSPSLTEAVNKFVRFVCLSDSERDLLEEPACPKVLGDIVESCVGAILLDTGFNLKIVWKVMLKVLDPVLRFSSLELNPIRELRELCQSCNFELELPDPVKDRVGYLVKVGVGVEGKYFSFSASNHNSKAARRVAAQEALKELKALGFKHKHKSLEEIVRLTKKEEAKLIGYDENPIIIDNIDSVHLENLSIGKSEETLYNSYLQRAEASSATKSAHQNQTSHPMRSIGQSRVFHGVEEQRELNVEDQNRSNGDIENNNYKEANGSMSSKSAKSQLYEICTANFWNPPSFVCCKEEGPSHLLMFTYKVTVELETISPTFLECFSEARLQKKAAQEHAAQGMLWYLKHVGYVPKS